MISLAMEAPISLLRELPYITEFDFALTHLFEQSGHYSDYYEWAVKSGREVVLDNSVNELGEPVSLEEMDTVAKSLYPTYIIPPDHLNDLEATLAATGLEDPNTTAKIMENFEEFVLGSTVSGDGVRTFFDGSAVDDVSLEKRNDILELYTADVLNPKISTTQAMANARLRWKTYKPAEFNQAGALAALKQDPTLDNKKAFADAAGIKLDEVEALLNPPM